MTSSEAFVETMVAHGTKNIFGIVGSAFMDALDIFEPAGIRFVPVQVSNGKMITFDICCLKTDIYWCLDILNAFDIYFYDFKHEQNAVHMADGYARALNDPNVAGVCIAQNGPGITNFVTGK